MSLEEELKAAQEALADPKTTFYIYKGAKYTLTGLRDIIIPRLEQEIKAQKQASQLERNKIDRAKKELADAEGALYRNQNAFEKRNLSESELNKSKELVVQKQNELNALLSATAAPSETVQATAAPSFKPTDTSFEQQEARRQAGLVPTATETPSAVTTPKVSKTVTRKDVDAALAASGLADTPENRKTIRADLKAGKQPIGDWLSVFKREFPQYSYLLDETTFGADVTALLQRAVTEKWYDSDQLATLMDQGFAGTQYYKNTTTSQQTFDKLTDANKQAQIDAQKIVIKDSYGNLQFDDATLTAIATKAARDGKKGKALDLYIYQESFAKPVGGMTFAQPTAATRALTSSAADEVRQIGRDYGVKVDDQTVQDVLTGKTTLDSLRQSYKIAARRWYKGAADDIDAGVTVAQLFQPYKQYAAAVLGKPMDQIDFIDDNGTPTIYSEALQGKDGPMSIGEWVQKLKSDDRYGWQFTSDAKQKVDSLVMSLEKAFGYRA